MDAGRTKHNRFLIGIALIGIAIELVAVALLASKRIGLPVAMPLIIAGMFTAFVPIFAVSRRTKR